MRHEYVAASAIRVGSSGLGAHAYRLVLPLGRCQIRRATPCLMPSVRNLGDER